MAKIHYLPDRADVEIALTETILNASLRVGIRHTHECGGNARCSTCRVLVMKGLEQCEPRNAAEEVLAEKLHLEPSIRLACQTRVRGDVQIRRLVVDQEDIAITDLTESVRPAHSGEELEIAVQFVDIRGFSDLSRDLIAYDLVHLLNRFLCRMNRAVTQEGGRIVPYTGDGFMAIYGLECPVEPSLAAVRAGLARLEATRTEFKPYVRSLFKRGFRIAIGIHYGEAVVGAIGAGNERTVTAIGDTPSFAQRVEAANRPAGTQLLVSDCVFARVRGKVRTRKLFSLQIPGRGAEHTLYEVVGLEP